MWFNNDLFEGGQQSQPMSRLCCGKLKVTMYSRPQTLWGDYCGDYTLSKDKINGRNYFLKVDSQIALWYMSTPMSGWGFGNLDNQNKSYDSVVIKSNCPDDLVKTCPHIIHDQWSYFDEIFGDWCSAGSINIIVECVENNAYAVEETIASTSGTSNIYPIIPGTAGKDV